MVPTLEVTPDIHTVTSDKESVEFKVKSNATWTVRCSESWISGYTPKGEGDGTIKVLFKTNQDPTSDRRADFVVAIPNKTVTVTLVQGKANVVEVLTAEVTEQTVSATTRQAKFTVNSNTTWTVSTDAPWIKSYTKEGFDNGTITLDFDVNSNSETDRTAEIVVSTKTMQIKLQLTQTKGEAVEDAKVVTMEQFNQAQGGDELYMLSGFVDIIVSATYGSVILSDHSGKALVYCLKTSKDGEDAKFNTLGVKVGDFITVIGRKGVFGADAELVDGYYVSHKGIGSTNIEDYNAKPDGSFNWYKVKGTVKSISNSSKGTLQLEDATGTVDVENIFSAYGAPATSFGDLNITVGSDLTIIACEKNNGKITSAIYLKHSAPKLTPGILARWGFNSDFIKQSGFDETYTGTKIDEEGKKDAREFDNKAGDGGRYIAAAEGTGKMSFVQVDKTSLDAEGKIASRLVYYTAQPGAGGVALDDYFLFEADSPSVITTGTSVKFAFVLRPAAKTFKYWMVEFYDGNEWKAFPNPQVQKVTIGGKEYSYNVERSTNEETTVEAVYITGTENEKAKIRIRAAGPMGADGTTIFSNGFSNGEVRFRGENKFKSPYIEIL